MNAKPTHEEIQARAHRLWEQAGKPEGREQEFWQQAERELYQEYEEEDGDSK